MTVSEKLLPCPFCGGTDLRTGGDDKIAGVWCPSCQAVGPNHYGEHEWNNRAASARANVSVKWIERWYGSEPMKGWSIVQAQGRDLVAYLGPGVDSKQVSAIVFAHNAALVSAPAQEGWQEMETYAGCAVVLVSRPTDRVTYTPTTAFRDAVGVWRVFRSEDGMTPVPFKPTHWMPVPASPEQGGE